MSRRAAVYPGETVHIRGQEATFYVVAWHDEGVVLMDANGERKSYAQGDAVTLRTEDIELVGLAVPTVPVWERLYWGIRERLGL